MCKRCEHDVPVTHVVHSDEMEIEVCEECAEAAMEIPHTITKYADIPGKLFINFIQ